MPSVRTMCPIEWRTHRERRPFTLDAGYHFGRHNYDPAFALLQRTGDT